MGQEGRISMSSLYYVKYPKRKVIHIADMGKKHTLCSREMRDRKVEVIEKLEKDDRRSMCMMCLNKMAKNARNSSIIARRRKNRDALAKAFKFIFNIKTYMGRRKTNAIKSYAFIPRYDYETTEAIDIAVEYVYKRMGNTSSIPLFVDAGCGCGNILLLMASKFSEKYWSAKQSNIVGIDIVRKNLDIAKAILSESNNRHIIYPESSICLINGDIFDFERLYGRADIIYYYRPIHRGDLQRKFEKLVISSCKVGGIIIGFSMEDWQAINRDTRFEMIDENRNVWLKVSK